MAAPPAATQELSPPQVAALLRAHASAVRAEMEALPDSVLSWHPAQDEWCAKEVLGHVIETERRGFAGRIRNILEGDEPALAAWDQRQVAAERLDCERDAAELLREYLQQRETSMGLVAGLRPDQLDRAGVHERVGRLTVRDLLHEWVHHDRGHLRQLLANTQAYVWPQMGNAQLFSVSSRQT
jgi:DinB superfamily